jgi:hypothetical protein
MSPKTMKNKKNFARIIGPARQTSSSASNGFSHLLNRVAALSSKGGDDRQGKIYLKPIN